MKREAGDTRDSAARRPRPKVERPVEPPLRLNVWRRWSAFFAARIGGSCAENLSASQARH